MWSVSGRAAMHGLFSFFSYYLQFFGDDAFLTHLFLDNEGAGGAGGVPSGKESGKGDKGMLLRQQKRKRGPTRKAGYYGGSFHHRSHGESFLVLAEDMFKSDGLYILDEPEAALSPRGIIRLMQRMDELVAQDCQFIIATHSPMLLCFPDAEVYQIGEKGIDSVRFQDTDHYRTTVRFLQNPESAIEDILGRKM